MSNQPEVRDNYSPLKDDFGRSSRRAIDSLQEMGPREVKYASLFLGSRWGSVCYTDEKGIPHIISPGFEKDARGREVRQRFFLGIRAEAATKDRAIKTEDLHKRRMPKEFMITSQADQMLQTVIPPAQDIGDKFQRSCELRNSLFNQKPDKI